jgi:hypothetical protein
MSRIDGRKIVGFAVVGTIGMLGIGQLYLPYIADRNKLRGLFEDEESLSEQAKLELQKIMKAEQQEVNNQATGAPAGSMWKNMKR